MNVTTTTRSTTRRIGVATGLLAVVTLSAGTGSAVAAKLITGADIKNNSVAGKDVKNGSLAAKDLNTAVKGQLNKPTLPGYEVISATTPVPSSTINTAYVRCSEGKIAVGGGAEWDSFDFQTEIVDSQPARTVGEEFYDKPDADFADAWRVNVKNQGPTDHEITVYVICASSS